MGNRRGLLLLLLLSGVAALGVSGCSRDERAAGRDTAPRPNLIVVSIDTLRPDMLGAYGYERPTSPTLDGLAARGVLFEIAVTPTPWTLPAHASLLTGLYPVRHGVRTHELRMRLGVETLAERLKNAGYTTASIFNTHHLDARWGLDRGFDHVHYERESVDRRGQAQV